jgi:hypothetical protein
VVSSPDPQLHLRSFIQLPDCQSRHVAMIALLAVNAKACGGPGARAKLATGREIRLIAFVHSGCAKLPVRPVFTSLSFESFFLPDP